jgi:hypothetical protein
MAFAAPRGAYTIIPSSTGPIDTESTAFLAGNHVNLAQTIEIRVRKGLTRGISGPNTGYFPEERRPKLAGVSRKAESEVAGSLVISSRQDVRAFAAAREKVLDGDAEHSRRHLTEEALMALAPPVGVLSRDETIEAVAFHQQTPSDEA